MILLIESKRAPGKYSCLINLSFLLYKILYINYMYLLNRSQKSLYILIIQRIATVLHYHAADFFLKTGENSLMISSAL